MTPNLTPPTAVELADWEQKAKAATPGVWITWGSGNTTGDRVCQKPFWFDEIKGLDELKEAEQIFTGDEGAYCLTTSDATHIATFCPDNALRLIALLKATENQRGDWEDRAVGAEQRLKDADNRMRELEARLTEVGGMTSDEVLKEYDIAITYDGFEPGELARFGEALREAIRERDEVQANKDGWQKRCEAKHKQIAERDRQLAVAVEALGFYADEAMVGDDAGVARDALARIGSKIK